MSQAHGPREGEVAAERSKTGKTEAVLAERLGRWRIKGSVSSCGAALVVMVVVVGRAVGYEFGRPAASSRLHQNRGGRRQLADGADGSGVFGCGDGDGGGGGDVAGKGDGVERACWLVDVLRSGLLSGCGRNEWNAAITRGAAER